MVMDKERAMSEKIAVISMMKNEADIVESFVRYYAAFADCIIIADHNSNDGTWEILEKLKAEYPFLVTTTVEQMEYIQSEIMTSLMELAAFLPYKASMWDSLEGEWEKAQTDENCNVLVVPIPYYDKTPSGNIKEWHWEGNEFPDNVIITDYRSVDLEKIHPDKIYIHNPYDERNLLTSVAPDYYSTKLKNQTNELVYIPYFVLNEQGINSKSVEGFAALPGVVYAHTVIVQSLKS